MFVCFRNLIQKQRWNWGYNRQVLSVQLGNFTPS